MLIYKLGCSTGTPLKHQNIEEFQHNKFSRGKWLGGLHHALPVAVPASKFFWGGKKILGGGKSVKNVRKVPKICHFYAEIVKFGLISTRLKLF